MATSPSSTPPQDGKHAAAAPQGHGIQALIDRLRHDGIDAGRQDAQQMLAQARAEIDSLRAAAREEADSLMARTRAQIRTEQETAQGALQLAYRDSLLRLKEAFLHDFGERLRRRVQTELADPNVLRQALLAVLRDDPDPTDGALFDTLAWDGVARQLREGVTLLPAPGLAGFRVALQGGHVEVHVTDEAVTELLKSHLMPRVRRQLDGGPLPGESGLGLQDDAPRVSAATGGRP
jgi:V/A-type H+-transporting ATPase subunit E